jgi:3-oxoadipate enol-lactonase
MAYVDRSGWRIYYRVDGDPGAPALVFSNSLGTTHDLWGPQVARFSNSFHLIRYDTRGHGLSGAPSGEYTIDQLGSDIVAVLDAAGVSRAHVCGLSLGGLSAMWLGIHVPERIESLTLASTGAKIGTATIWQERIDQVRAGGLESIAEGAKSRWFTGPFRAAHPEAVEQQVRMLVGGPAIGYIGCCAVLRDTDLREDIGAIVAPTLVIGAVDDPVTPPGNAELMHSRIRNAELAILPGSHIANVEQAHAFNDHLLRFLNGR